MAESRSSRALDALLQEDGPAAQKIRRRWHRVILSRYRNGRAKPDASGVSEMHRLSRGAVPADGWEDL